MGSECLCACTGWLTFTARMSKGKSRHANKKYRVSVIATDGDASAGNDAVCIWSLAKGIQKLLCCNIGKLVVQLKVEASIQMCPHFV